MHTTEPWVLQQLALRSTLTPVITDLGSIPIAHVVRLPDAVRIVAAINTASHFRTEALQDNVFKELMESVIFAHDTLFECAAWTSGADAYWRPGGRGCRALVKLARVMHKAMGREHQ